MAPPSQDRCHRALLVLDIVFHIFEQAMYDTEGGQKTLARLSRTCRAWKEPGYDVLWRDANLIAALRVLAPMNIVTVEDAELIDEDEEMGLALSRTSYYQFTRPLTLADWARFGSISKRVHTLRGESPDPKIHGLDLGAGVIRTLREERPTDWQTALFPCVKRLHWNHGSSLELVSLLVTEPLIEFSATVDDSMPLPTHGQLTAGAPWGVTPDEWMDDERVEQMNANHGHTRWHGHPGTLPFMPEVSPHNTYLTNLAHYLNLQPRLRTLSLSISARTARLRSFLVAVATSLSLKQLTLSYEGHLPRTPWSTQQDQDPLFPQLTVLQLDAPIVRGMVDLVRIAGGQLNELIIFDHNKYGRRTLEERLPLEDLIAAVASHPQLRIFRLKELGYRLLRYGVMARLGDCAGLEVLEVTSGGTLVLTDDEMRDLVAHLPALTSLKIEGTRGKDGVPYEKRLSMAALGIVASHCPLIQYINLDVDGSEIPDYTTTLPHPSATLQTIDLGWSHDRPIDDPRAVALYLSWLSSHDEYAIRVEWNRAKTGTMYDVKWDTAARWLRDLLEHPISERPEVVNTLA